MPIDWSEGNLPFLKRQLENGSVALFLGAGFSNDAKNILNGAPPLGSDLAKLLVESCAHPYHGEPLSIAYETAQHTMGTKALNDLLTKHYAISNFPSWYYLLKDITWHRIYTINIDNLVQKIYSSGSDQRLDTIVCPSDIKERDQYFSTLQCIHLHGHIEELNKGLIFSLPDFAGQTTRPNPWYQQVMDDYFTVPFVFIGTNIEEPQFQHYLSQREIKGKDKREYRPKSFIVNPNISIVREKNFAARNIESVKCSAQEFFEALKNDSSLYKYQLNYVRSTVFPYISEEDFAHEDDFSILRYYDHIRPDNLPISKTSKGDSFFLGAEPTWYDIEREHDAKREINNSLHELIENGDTEAFRCFVLHGPAGGGKTTTLMRTAFNISLNGKAVYYAKKHERINIEPILKIAHEAKSNQIFLFIDNFRRQLGAIDQVKNEMKQTKNLVLVLCERTNAYYRSFVIDELSPQEVKMPDLCVGDVKEIINKLEKNHFLGVLKNRIKQVQISEFMNKASKQLLVAMKEATSGKGFDAILRHEFVELSHGAQLAYLICCLAVDSGAPGVYRRHLLACLGNSDCENSVIVNEFLRGIIIPANDSNTLVKPRHRLIAHWVSREIASEDQKYKAFARFLIQISSDIKPSEITRRSPTYLSYRGMINSDGLWEALNHNEDAIFALYEQLIPYYEHDFLFWLHYGMVYIKAGYFDVAENYLNQSLSLYPHSHHTQHQLGILYLKQACKAENPVMMIEKADEGKNILLSQIQFRGDYDSYPYAAYLTHVSKWYLCAGRNIVSDDEWQELKIISDEALRKYPRDDYIVDAVKVVDRSYLQSNI